MTLSNSIFLLAGFIAGCVIAWLALRGQLISTKERVTGKDLELDEIRKSREAAQAESRSLQEQLNSQTSARSAAEVKALRVSPLEEEVRALQAKIDKLTSDLSDAKARREEERKSEDEKAALWNAAEQQMSNRFERLANEILEDKSKKFTELNKINLGSMLNPLDAQLKELKTRIEVTYDNETQQRTRLSAELEQLRCLNERMDQDAIELTNALLGQSKTMGDWGEFILEEILQKSGLVKDREYKVQTEFVTEEGKRPKPDVVIYLPEGRHLIIDSKVNLVAYKRYCASEGKKEIDKALNEHVAAMRRQINLLDFKKYQENYQLNSLDFVLMFVPLEPAFISAVRHDLTLFDDAFSKNIVVVCPSTLLATMRTVANIWKQETQKRNVMEIANKAGDLYDKFVGFVLDLDDIGDKLKRAQASFDGARNKLVSGHGNLVSRVETIKNLGARARKKLPASFVTEALDEVDRELRPDAGELDPDAFAMLQKPLTEESSNGYKSDEPNL